MGKSGFYVLYLPHKNTIPNMLEMIGVHECKIDNKGRILIPSALKNQLDDIISEGFIIKRSIFQQCLEIYPKSIWNEEIKDIYKLSRFVKKNTDFIRVFMAGVKEVVPDGTGRMQIPRDLAVFANLNKDIVLASTLNIIEVWDKENYESKIAQDQINFSDLAEEVMGQKS